MNVRVVWHHVSDALTLPFWAPAKAQGGAMSLKDKVAIGGVGQVHLEPGDPKRNEGDLAILAAKAALDDAGLARDDLQGVASDASGTDPSNFAKQMGVPEVSFGAALTSGAGGGPGGLALAASAIVGGFARFSEIGESSTTTIRTRGRDLPRPPRTVPTQPPTARRGDVQARVNPELPATAGTAG
jgi:hypothetical protein